MAQPMKDNVPNIGLNIEAIIRQYETSHCRHLVDMKQQKNGKTIGKTLSSKGGGLFYVLTPTGYSVAYGTRDITYITLLHTARQFVTSIKLRLTVVC